MPRILKYVDQIAREKGRDVLFAAFDKEFILITIMRNGLIEHS